MIDIKIKDSFFDREKVLRKIDRGRRQMLSRMGAFVRTRAKSSIKYSPAPSYPGDPPKARRGSAFRRSILFGYDHSSDSVVVGPIRYNGRNTRAPELLEHGGAHTLKKERHIQLLKTTRHGKSRQKRVRATGRWITIPAGTKLTYAARPFMSPALKKEIQAGTFPRQIMGRVRE